VLILLSQVREAALQSGIMGKKISVTKNNEVCSYVTKRNVRITGSDVLFQEGMLIKKYLSKYLILIGWKVCIKNVTHM